MSIHSDYRWEFTNLFLHWHNKLVLLNKETNGDGPNLFKRLSILFETMDLDGFAKLEDYFSYRELKLLEKFDFLEINCEEFYQFSDDFESFLYDGNSVYSQKAADEAYASFNEGKKSKVGLKCIK